VALSIHHERDVWHYRLSSLVVSALCGQPTGRAGINRDQRRVTYRVPIPGPLVADPAV
jgi:hypothetical protein